MIYKCNNPIEVCQEAYWLAYQASSPTGLGHLRATNDRTKSEVWNSVTGKALTDYAFHDGSPLRPQADYVYGRMMKLYVEIKEDGIEYRDGEPRSDYQSWCRKYPTYQSLFEAAEQSLATAKA